MSRISGKIRVKDDSQIRVDKGQNDQVDPGKKDQEEYDNDNNLFSSRSEQK